MDRCRIICIEGVDRSGKATQASMLYDALADSHSVTLVEVPTDGYTHKLIYWMLKRGWAKRFPNTFQLVHFANKFGFELFVLPTMKHLSDYVILDRWRLSAIVYGNATGVNPCLNKFLNDRLIKPDITLIMHGAEHVRNEEKDTYEADGDLQKAVKAAYFEHAMNNKHDHEIISNVGTADDVHLTVMGTLVHRGVLSEQVMK